MLLNGAPNRALISDAGLIACKHYPKNFKQDYNPFFSEAFIPNGLLLEISPQSGPQPRLNQHS